MEKLGILGGTFNPVHNGHIYLAKSFMEKLSLDKILLIPDALPPHKDFSKEAADEDRLNMLSLAAKDIPFLSVCDWEIKKGGKSYTYFTLLEMKKQNPESEIYFLVGSDMFLSLESWFNYPEIMNMATFCAVARNKEDIALLQAKKEYFSSLGFKTEILKTEPLEISSTEIREKIKKSENINELLPEAVAEYIRERKLYV
ncbi:MAG: nicotinate (nicotinamide) nucleotide adenylyltransferase [Oscillospiraceae bacterium]|nr:nicotinate (nicotinamide) nucleotide adenylyltransferase [Oscillospiraceae bacterium]